MRLIAAAAIAAIVITGAAEAKTWRVRPGADAEQELQRALIEARPGDTVQLGRGRFELIIVGVHLKLLPGFGPALASAYEPQMGLNDLEIWRRRRPAPPLP